MAARSRSRSGRINAWGTGSTNLVLNIGYAPLGGLAIANVTNTWSKPYLLDFSFSLRDGTDPTNSPVVRAAELIAGGVHGGRGADSRARPR